uniref:Uncharacterized protein n=1 Tax=Romanomermis culicivorax TaxID=13658 RepID=A0A915IKU7_ROMCU
MVKKDGKEGDRRRMDSWPRPQSDQPCRLKWANFFDVSSHMTTSSAITQWSAFAFQPAKSPRVLMTFAIPR